jgi:hypothetical protein
VLFCRQSFTERHAVSTANNQEVKMRLGFALPQLGLSRASLPPFLNSLTHSVKDPIALSLIFKT